MVNWYLSDQLRLEFAYGYGVLNRFDVRGAHALLSKPASGPALKESSMRDSVCVGHRAERSRTRSRADHESNNARTVMTSQVSSPLMRPKTRGIAQP